LSGRWGLEFGSCDRPIVALLKRETLASLSRLAGTILPLDADDMLEPEMLQRTVELLERDPYASVVYTDVRQFGEDSRVVASATFDKDRLAETNQLSYCALYRREVGMRLVGTRRT